VPNARLLTDRAGDTALLVERFDHVQTPNGIRKLHQEDACQLLDKYPADKYSTSYREIAEALHVCSNPEAATLRLIELIAFSYLIGNGDLHAKNVSILVSPSGEVELSPAYDVVSTLAYGDDHMALEFEGRDHDLRRGDFVRFGERCNVSRQATENVLDRLGACVPANLAELEDIGLTPAQNRDLRKALEQRARDLGPRAGD
jgi:serine/threonine-protein kinase HipA